MSLTEVTKPLTISISGIVGFFEPTFPFAGVLFFAIILDCLSAFDLSRRLKKKYPERVTGKFKSEYALKMLKTFMQMYSVILLVFLIETHIIPMHTLNLTNYTAAICCAIQLWSILENASSENGKMWAKVLQKIMVNKAERHFDIKLDLDKREEEENG
jgi:hypothetical protein